MREHLVQLHCSSSRYQKDHPAPQEQEQEQQQQNQDSHNHLNCYFEESIKKSRYSYSPTTRTTRRTRTRTRTCLLLALSLFSCSFITITTCYSTTKSTTRAFIARKNSNNNIKKNYQRTSFSSTDLSSPKRTETIRTMTSSSGTGTSSTTETGGGDSNNWSSFGSSRNWKIIKKDYNEEDDSLLRFLNERNSEDDDWGQKQYEDALSLYDKLMSCDDAYIEPGIKDALNCLDHAYRLYGPKSVICSFNGGKDAVVILHLVRAAHAKYVSQQILEQQQQQQQQPTDGEPTTTKPKIIRPRLLYFYHQDEFPDLMSFVYDTIHEYDLEMIAFREGIKFQDGLRLLVTNNFVNYDINSNSNNKIKGQQQPFPMAFVLGTRATDPNAGSQGQFAPSSHYMPPFMRVNPVLDWTYGLVWHFLRLFQLPYCSLYDQGYTSLGTVKDTLPCPALLVPGGSNATMAATSNTTTTPTDTITTDAIIINTTHNGYGLPKYWPAYMLRDWDQERAGRVKKKKNKEQKEKNPKDKKDGNGNINDGKAKGQQQQTSEQHKAQAMATTATATAATTASSSIATTTQIIASPTPKTTTTTTATAANTTTMTTTTVLPSGAESTTATSVSVASSDVFRASDNKLMDTIDPFVSPEVSIRSTLDGNHSCISYSSSLGGGASGGAAGANNDNDNEFLWDDNNLNWNDMKKIGLLIIGDEILKGFTADINTISAAKAIRKYSTINHDIVLKRVIVINDNQEDIVEQINYMQEDTENIDVIITSGGIGPTHDDVTIKSVAAALNRDMVLHKEMAYLLKSKMNPNNNTANNDTTTATTAAAAIKNSSSSNDCVDDNDDDVFRDLTEAQKKMAILPSNSKLKYLSNDENDWPVLQCYNIFILPGVPEFFAKKIDNVARYLSSSSSSSSPPVATETATTTTKKKQEQEQNSNTDVPRQRSSVYEVVLSIDEASIVPVLNQVVEKHPHVSFGSYPFVSHPEFKTVLTLEGERWANKEESSTILYDDNNSRCFSKEQMDQHVKFGLDELITLLPKGSILRVVDNTEGNATSLS